MPIELESDRVACLHTAAPLRDKTLRVSTQVERIALQQVDGNVYAGRLSDAPINTQIRVSVVDLWLCDSDPRTYPPLATRGLTVNGTALTHLTQEAPLGAGFIFTVKPDGTVVQ